MASSSLWTDRRAQGESGERYRIRSVRDSSICLHREAFLIFLIHIFSLDNLIHIVRASEKKPEHSETQNLGILPKGRKTGV